jgi:RNA-directed DNA polymerase
MNDSRKSDNFVVPGKPPNKGGGAPQPAEGVEERGLTKGNPDQQTSRRTRSRARLQSALDRIRQAAQREKEQRFTALWHHVYDLDRLKQAYRRLNRKAAAGVDRVTWQSYGEQLEERLEDLSGRLKRGAYRARPVRRVYIPKDDGRQRPLGVPALEDKLVQTATTEVLEAVYEQDFLGFSYGFRPGRGQHNALDALTIGLKRRKVNWVLDADIRGFFDAIDHEWLIRFVEHRIGDQRVIRHIKKWLNAGVLEDGRVKWEERGTPQGGSISPLLANIYLHHVFDLWIQAWRKRAEGDVIVVRYADDFVVGFQHRHEAERFMDELRERLAKFGLELHSDKTRLIEFGRFAAENRQRRGEGKPETFDFLGFTHACGRTRNGKYHVVRLTMKKKLRAKLKAVKAELRRRMHRPIPETGKWLAKVVAGYYQYHAVPGNARALWAFRFHVGRLWWRTLNRRSQRSRCDRARLKRLMDRWVPRPQILHPYPEQRLRVIT